MADEPSSAKRVDLAFIPPQAVAAIVLHPRAVLTGHDSEWLPTEVITAAGMKQAGVDPVMIDEAVVLFASPTKGTEPDFAAILRFAQPYSEAAVTAKLVGREKQVGGKTVVDLGGPQNMLLFLPDAKTIIVGAGPLVEKMLTV
ncbi:MAG TPA: hypothetical protein VKB78_08190, partial [Pirellulales bacterium]|nr:hypothetical protein [Pirellulales bacterium]